MRTVLRFLSITLVLLAASCSRLSVAYKLADEYILRQADNYFDLSEDQYSEFKRRVEDDLKRIRDNRAPQASQFLRKILSHVKQNDVTAATVDGLFQEGQTLFDHIVHEFETTAFDLTSQTNSDQIKNFTEEYNEKLNDFKDDVKGPNDRYKMQRKKSLKWTKEWIGWLEVGQEEALEEFIKANPFPFELQVKSRETMRDKFIEAKKDPKRLKEFLKNLNEERDPEYKEALNKYNQALKVFIVDIYKSLNKRQKSYLIERLETRIKQLEDLALKK
jgi:hypothetical protein